MTNQQSTPLPGGTWTMGDFRVARFGYGAMQLTGPGVLGPPADHDGAIALLKEAVELGINHIDTAGAYGPRVTDRLIREALHPYPETLLIATKVGARRDEQGGWPIERDPQSLRRQVRSYFGDLQVDRLDLVNLRVGDDDSVAESFETLAELQQQGVIRHLGMSNASAAQIAEAQSIAPIVCVQNMYNLAHRQDDALIDDLAAQGIAYVPFLPLTGLSPEQFATLSTVAGRLQVRPMSVALAWLLQRSPNLLLIPGTSSLDHLRENVLGAGVHLSEEDVAELDGIGAAQVPGA